MIGETIRRIRNRIAGADSLDDSRKDELLRLLGELEHEVGALAETQAEDAENIAGFVHISAREAIRKPGNPELLDIARQGLSLSIREFETSHPKLVETVNGISTMLANLGI
jgi:hypothetical protein